MYVYVCFDIEDLVHPASDDAPRDIADALADAGVVASMCVVGEKARLWEMRGRRDVIAAVGKHDVGLHTNRHSVHPTVSEYLEDKGWEDGVAEAMRREAPGARDLARLFGSYPSTWGTGGSSWGPQIPAATHRLGIPSNIYSHVTLERAGAWWFAGQLCYPDGASLHGGEDTCCDDARFDERLRELLAVIDGLLRAGTACVLLFGGHPTRFMYTQFWDAINFRAGRNTPAGRFLPAPRRTAASYSIGVRNVQRMVQAVGELPGVRLTSVRELNGRFAAECGPIKHGALARLAQSAAGGEIIGVDDPAASPAQLLDLLSRAGQRWSGGTRWATPMLSRTVLGPDCLPPALDREVIVPGEHVRALCHSVASYIDATGRLPSRVDAGGVPVGPGPLTVGLARWFESANRGGDAPDLTLRPGPEEPAIAAPLVEKQIYRSLPGWPPHRPDLRLDQLALHLRLQTWSLKPAVLAT